MATEQELRAAINQIDNVETLRSIFQDVANALRRKGVDQVSIFPSEFAGLIDGIETGIDTSDATAVASDIANGKIAYGVNGRIVGNVETIENQQLNKAGYVAVWEPGERIRIVTLIDNDLFLRNVPSIILSVEPRSFGDAKRNEVLQGRFFTSMDGFQVEGTYVPPESGTDTDDADATATDIVKDKTAYVKGEKVTGTVPEVKSGSTSLQGSVALSSPGLADTRVTVTNQLTFDTVVRKGGRVQANVEGSEFGTATTDDVLSGKTFTGASGLKKTGTLVPQTGTDTSDATATASDIAMGKTAYVNGAKIQGTLNQYLSGALYTANMSKAVSGTDLVMTYTNKGDVILRNNSIIRSVSELSTFGNATAADVASGKTFTSSAGLKVTGTASLDVSMYTTIYSGINNVTFSDHSITFDAALFNGNISSIKKFVGIQGATWSNHPSNMSGKNILIGFYVAYDGVLAYGVYTSGNGDINSVKLTFSKTSSNIKISCGDNIYFYNSYQTIFG